MLNVGAEKCELAPSILFLAEGESSGSSPLSPAASSSIASTVSLSASADQSLFDCSVPPSSTASTTVSGKAVSTSEETSEVGVVEVPVSTELEWLC